jgi:DASS family divalent anion:Na+ symporter
MLAGGVPPVLATLSLAFTTNLFGGLTHYASGQAAVYYGSGYVGLQSMLRMGAICGAANLAIWGVAGSLWWKVIGLY